MLEGGQMSPLTPLKENSLLGYFQHAPLYLLHILIRVCMTSFWGFLWSVNMHCALCTYSLQAYVERLSHFMLRMLIHKIHVYILAIGSPYTYVRR